MNYLGTWKFHSILSFDENDQPVYLTAEEYLNAPMPYIDADDPDEVAGEMKERRLSIGSKIKICDGGLLYMLMPIPENAPQDELNEILASGAMKLVDGMLCEKPLAWEERNGELWYDSGMEGEVFGEAADPWVKAVGEDGMFHLFTTRFVKED